MRCLIVLSYVDNSPMDCEISGDEELGPTNNSWSEEYEVPDGTPDSVIVWVGRGKAFMGNWTAQDTTTRYYKWNGQWVEID